MNKYIQTLLVLAFCFILSGCITQPEKPPVLIEKIETVVIAVPIQMSRNVGTPAPPHKPDEYAVLSCSLKEDSNMQLIATLYEKLKTANDKLDGIALWTTKQVQLYKKE